jgi:uncharacterized protein (TIGR02996 family)
VDIEAALLQAIRETPEDDTPRLALGDWLMEQPEAVQQARGEFIHLQCRLAKMPSYEPQRPALEAREKALKEEHAEAWLDGLTAFVEPNAWTFERGMLGLDLQGPQPWLSPEDLAWLADWQWADRLVLRDFDDVPEQWLSSAALSGITSLACSGPGARTAIHVLVRGGLSCLRVLGVSHAPVTDEDVKKLVASPAMGHLTNLSLCATHVTCAGLVALARSPSVIGLRSLDLSLTPVGREGVLALASSPHLSGLTTLFLIQPEGTERIRTYRIGDAVAGALVESGQLRHLKKLALHRCGVGPEGMRALTGSSSLSRLAFLYLSGPAIGDRGARLLASSPSLCRLAELSLCGCGITAGGVASLAQSSNLRQLRGLVLRSNPLKSAGAKALASSPHLGQLLYLNLEETRCDDDGVASLASSPYLAGLTEMDLSGNAITERGARLLASPASFQHLHALTFRYNLINDSGRDALRARFGDCFW